MSRYWVSPYTSATGCTTNLVGYSTNTVSTGEWVSVSLPTHDYTQTHDYVRWAYDYVQCRDGLKVSHEQLENSRVVQQVDVVRPQGYSVRYKKTEAEMKAERLFRKVLGDDVYKKMVRKKHLVVLGNDKKKYLLKKDEIHRIQCDDGVSYGNHSILPVPFFDEALARVLALKTHAKAIREQSCKISIAPADGRLLEQIVDL